LNSAIQKVNAKLDAIKYSIKRKQEELQRGNCLNTMNHLTKVLHEIGECTLADYKNFIMQQEQFYAEITATQARQVKEYQDFLRWTESK
jgi:hypothetical protein